MRKLANVKVNLKFPFIGEIEGNWQPDEDERRAAWELYVELVTRVALTQVQPTEGGLRESLSSLHSLFDTARHVLREHGPGVARPKGKGNLSFGYLAVAILNLVLRPVLSRWHPLLLEYEGTRPNGVSTIAHERQWDRNQELRAVLVVQVQRPLAQYADLLAEVAGVPPLTTVHHGTA